MYSNRLQIIERVQHYTYLKLKKCKIRMLSLLKFWHRNSSE